jgi:hypothetical protein
MCPRRFLLKAKILQDLITDEEIEKALEKWPAQAAVLNGREIAEKLRHRRDRLPEYAIELSREIKKNRSAGKRLKGTEDLNLPPSLIKCFECN